jgi:hypothetical protein
MPLNCLVVRYLTSTILPAAFKHEALSTEEVTYDPVG